MLPHIALVIAIAWLIIGGLNALQIFADTPAAAANLRERPLATAINILLVVLLGPVSFWPLDHTDD